MNHISRRKAELTVDGQGREVSSKVGTYSDKLTCDLATKHKGKVVPVRYITKVQYGRMSANNERYVRRKISTAVNLLLRAGIPSFPVYKPEGRHEVMGIKVITHYSDEDMKSLEEYQNGAITRGELSYAKADAIKKAMEGLKQSEKPE